MKKIICIAVLLLTTTSCLAQSGYQEKGSRAICFSFDGLDLGAYQGGLGFKYWFTDNRAFIGSLISGYSKNIIDENNGDSGTEPTKNEKVNIGIGTYFGMEFHSWKKEKFSPYLGSGILLMYEKINNKLEHGNSHTHRYKSVQLSYSLNIALGVEYQLRKNISISGQYSYLFTYKNGENKNSVSDQNNSTGYDTRNISIGLGSPLLTLSLYF